MKKKITFFIKSLTNGGAERVTIYLAQYLITKGFDVEILTITVAEMEYDLSSSIKRKALFSKGHPVKQFELIKRLRSYLKDNNPELIIGMGTTFTPYIIFANLLLKTKVILSERNSPRNFKGKKITKLLTNLLINCADAYIFQTSEAKEYYHWISGKQAVIPNPLFVDNLPEPYSGKRNNEIVNVGRLNTQKNHELLISSYSDIASKYPDYNLIIYGEGPEREKLESLIKSLDLEGRVFLPGAYNDVLQRIRKASMFVFSSNFEGMPNALIEAMALGIPVISTDCPSGGPRELIEHGVNGLLTPVNEKRELTHSIEELLSNKKKAMELGSEAIRIRNKLESKKIGKTWLDFIVEVI